MFGDHFYHATMRKSVAVFGTLFNNLQVVRKKSDGSIINQVRVPLAYGPKEKYLARLDSATGFDAQMGIKLPRMAFEITSLTLDQTQKVAKRNVIAETHGSDITKKKTIKHYTAYDIGMSLYILAKNQLNYKLNLYLGIPPTKRANPIRLVMKLGTRSASQRGPYKQDSVGS